ncbi:MAG: hypothetical protein JW786_03175 [Desulfobacterales bacterium]|nr:hypothetical protein [Desulfobacterales bacterium]
MKITNSEIIKNGEKELIDTITGDLDWKKIENSFKEKHHLSIHDDIEYKEGDLVVYDNQVAYKLNFDVKVPISVLIDRMGNFLTIKTPIDSSETHRPTTTADISEPEIDDDLEPIDLFESISEEKSDQASFSDPEKGPAENISQMASEVAQMISEINRE